MNGEQMLNELGYYRDEQASIEGWEFFEKLSPKYECTYIAIYAENKEYYKDAWDDELLTEDEKIAIEKYMEEK